VGAAASVTEEYGIPLRLHPADNVLIEDGTRTMPLGEGTVELAGLGITVEHTPGHPAGSVLFRDLTRSLLKVLTLSDESVVLPGHGTSTTIGRERSANPFLTGVK
jgi:glyoxylase-like metal-dependent hydrolase (beta-lactamase superfamily II)